jgi:hypothetical protein
MHLHNQGEVDRFFDSLFDAFVLVVTFSVMAMLILAIISL